jgi:hypothetical protein
LDLNKEPRKAGKVQGEVAKPDLGLSNIAGASAFFHRLFPAFLGSSFNLSIKRRQKTGDGGGIVFF